MCGILLIICKSPEKSIPKIQTGYELLYKRGPDSGSLTIKDNIIHGFRRLSVVGTTSQSDQPFCSDGITMMCNGEIYNHKKLEEEYDLHCESGSDCECILQLYKKIGFEATVNVLDGVFAIVIHDENNNSVFMARDRIGVRPLFYGLTYSGNLVISSLAGCMSGYCTHITHMPPGMITSDGDYFNIKFTPHVIPLIDTNINELSSTIKNTITESVRKRLMADRPIACMLSGGLDSSLITSIMCKLVGPKNVRTYSIGMEGSIDLEYAQKVATFLGTTHTEVKFTPEEGFAAIPEIIKDLESYDITTIRASVGMWLLSKYISENTDDIVIMSGEGADELYCGYLYFHNAPSNKQVYEESKRLVDQLYLYDVLRADRCVSSHGLELRVPFLDKKSVEVALSIQGILKKPINGIEKYLLRKCFVDGYLPEEVLMRRKDGFSDGVSSSKKSWFTYIQDYVNDLVPDEEYAIHGGGFPSKEAYYYKKLYNKHFLLYQPVYEYWLPKWVDHGGEPSGRLITCPQTVFRKQYKFKL
jgi:asparagine synthase (glutamine-hydrolysing)